MFSSAFKVLGTSIFALAALAAAALLAPLPASAQDSGMPTPRFVSLRAAEVNLRTGPGVQYPVEWIFQRESLPVEVLREYRTWRLIRDWEGTQGWVHQSMLSGKRTFIVTGKERTIRAEPDVKSKPVAVIEPPAVGELISCPPGSVWCRVKARGIEGWLRKIEFWGAYQNEAFQ